MPTTTSTRPGLRERIVQAVEGAYEAKVETVGAPVMRHLEKAVMLQELDRHWREHLAAMDYLRQGIHLRAYAQKNPKQEYKREAFELFGTLLERIKHDTVSLLSRIQVRSEAEIEEQERERERQMARQLQMQHAAPQSAIAADERPVGGGRGAVLRRAAVLAADFAGAGGGFGGARQGGPFASQRHRASSRSFAKAARSVATSLAPAARARNTSTATASWRAKPDQRKRAPRRRRHRVRRCRSCADRAAARREGAGRALGISRRQAGGGRKRRSKRLVRELREELGIEVRARGSTDVLRCVQTRIGRVWLDVWIVSRLERRAARPRRPGARHGSSRSPAASTTSSRPTRRSSRHWSA